MRNFRLNFGNVVYEPAPPPAPDPDPEPEEPAILSASTSNVTEGTDSFIVWNFNLSASLADPVDLSLALSGTATGADYGALQTSTNGSTWNTGTTVSFAAGDTLVQARVPLTDDADDDDNETVTLTATVTDGNTTNTTASATATIIDNDSPPVSSGTYPHFNGDGWASFPSDWVPGNNFTVTGSVLPTVAGTRIFLGDINNTDNYISFFAADQRLTVKLGGGSQFSIVKDYLDTQVDFELVMTGSTGTLTWGADSVAVTAGAGAIQFNTLGRNSLGFGFFDGWMMQMDLTDDSNGSNSRSLDFDTTAGVITDTLGTGALTLQSGLDATDWSALP